MIALGDCEEDGVEEEEEVSPGGGPAPFTQTYFCHQKFSEELIH